MFFLNFAWYTFSAISGTTIFNRVDVRFLKSFFEKMVYTAVVSNVPGNVCVVYLFPSLTRLAVFGRFFHTNQFSILVHP